MSLFEIYHTVTISYTPFLLLLYPPLHSYHSILAQDTTLRLPSVSRSRAFASKQNTHSEEVGASEQKSVLSRITRCSTVPSSRSPRDTVSSPPAVMIKTRHLPVRPPPQSPLPPRPLIPAQPPQPQSSAPPSPLSHPPPTTNAPQTPHPHQRMKQNP